MNRPSQLSPGDLIGERYRLEHELESDGGRAFAARDETTGMQVWATVIPRAHGDALRPGLNLEHPHLAQLLSVIEHEGETLVVSEAVPGPTLNDRMKRGEPLEHLAAVRAALRVADAVTELHHAGAVHGRIHPSTIVIEPEERAAPVLSYGPVQNGPLLRWPGSPADAAPSERDDSFAVAALLYEMLLGSVPAAEGLTDKRLIEEQVHDPALGLALWHALTRDESQRSKQLKPLQRELARWFVDHPGAKAASNSAPPPPLPATAVPSPSLPHVISAPTPRRKTRWVLPLALLGVLLGLSAAWALSRGKRVQVVEVSRPAPKPAIQQAEIKLGEVPVTGQEQLDASVGDKLTSCVAGFLPKGTFVRTPDVSWLCSESNAIDGTLKLRVAVVSGGRGTTTDAMKTFSKIGWYDMPIWAVIRTGCCDMASAITLPEPAPKCDQLDSVLQEIGSAVLSSQSFDEALQRYDTRARCEFNAGRVGVYHQKGSPQPFEQGVFREFVKAVQTP
jgi:serine/threonine protein kinase